MAGKNPWDKPAGDQTSTATAPAEPEAAPGAGFTITTGASPNKKIVIYGSGGIGKSTLADACPGKTLLVDTDGGDDFTRARVRSWAESLAVLCDPQVLEFDNIFVDSGSRWEDQARDHVVENVPTSSGAPADSIESFGFGKGFTHIYERMIEGFAALDTLHDQGKNVGIICHGISVMAPNVFGEDFLQYQPRLLSGQKNGSGNVRALAKEWASFLLFIGLDAAAKKGKAQGAGTRTIYTTERPHFWAKSRGLPMGKTEYPYTMGEDGTIDMDIWTDIFSTGIE